MLKEFKRINDSQFYLLWKDGHEGLLSLTTLRQACPCAGCQGESVLLHTYTPKPSPDLPGKFDLKGVDVVGSYALQFRWGDGHGEGIYTWEHLRSLCECSECASQREKTHLP